MIKVGQRVKYTNVGYDIKAFPGHVGVRATVLYIYPATGLLRLKKDTNARPEVWHRNFWVPVYNRRAK